MPLLVRMQPHIFLKITSLLLNDGPDSVWNFDTVRKKEKMSFQGGKALKKKAIASNQDDT